MAACRNSSHGGGDVMSGAARPETRWVLPWIDAPLPACAETWLVRPVMDARQCGPCPPLPGVATQSRLVRLRGCPPDMRHSQPGDRKIATLRSLAHISFTPGGA